MPATLAQATVSGMQELGTAIFGPSNEEVKITIRQRIADLDAAISELDGDHSDILAELYKTDDPDVVAELETIVADIAAEQAAQTNIDTALYADAIIAEMQADELPLIFAVSSLDPATRDIALATDNDRILDFAYHSKEATSDVAKPSGYKNEDVAWASSEAFVLK